MGWMGRALLKLMQQGSASEQCNEFGEWGRMGSVPKVRYARWAKRRFLVCPWVGQASREAGSRQKLYPVLDRLSSMGLGDSQVNAPGC